MGREMGGRFKRKGIYVYLWLIHVEVWQKTTKFCKAIIPQLKKISTHFCCCYSIAHSSPTLCDPMDCNMPGFPVLHYLLEFIQTHVHWVNDAIQPSHPLSSPSPPAFNLSSIRGFSNDLVLRIRWPSIGPSASASVLPMNIQGWFHLGLTGLILQSKGLKSLLQHHNLIASVLQCLVST